MRCLAVPACLFALLLLGCGDDEEKAPSGTEEAPSRSVTVPAGGTVRLVGMEYSFDPADVVVKGAGPLTLRLKNEGALAHNAKVFRSGDEIGGTPTFPGGRTESGRVNLEHGNYELICTVGDHAERGMVGTLEVR